MSSVFVDPSQLVSQIASMIRARVSATPGWEAKRVSRSNSLRESGILRPPWAAVRAPEQLLDDPHLHDRGFWKEVEHPEIGRSFVYPGEAAIYNGSPWAISRRAPLVGEHNAEIFCGELGLSRGELSALAENGVI